MFHLYFVYARKKSNVAKTIDELTNYLKFKTDKLLFNERQKELNFVMPGRMFSQDKLHILFNTSAFSKLNNVTETNP